jgi:hypothetical protein
MSHSVVALKRGGENQTSNCANMKLNLLDIRRYKAEAVVRKLSKFEAGK